MLNKDQKEAIKSLLSHPGWKVVELINETDLNNLGRQLLSVDLSDDKNLQLIKDNQIYTKARNDFVRSIKECNLDFYIPSIK